MRSSLVLITAAGAIVACSAEDLPAEVAAPIVPDGLEASLTEVRGCRGTIDHGLGGSIRVFANDVAASAYGSQQWPLAEGSLLVKAVYDDPACDGASLLGYTAMRKEAPGFAPEVADWRWQETDAARRVLDVDLQRCASCHTSCKGRDFTCTDP